MAKENFISDSLELDQIRMEKRKVVEIANLLSIIENLIKSGNLDSSSYEALRTNSSPSRRYRISPYFGYERNN